MIPMRAPTYGTLHSNQKERRCGVNTVDSKMGRAIEGQHNLYISLHAGLFNIHPVCFKEYKNRYKSVFVIVIYTYKNTVTHSNTMHMHTFWVGHTATNQHLGSLYLDKEVNFKPVIGE